MNTTSSGFAGACGRPAGLLCAKSAGTGLERTDRANRGKHAFIFKGFGLTAQPSCELHENTMRGERVLAYGRGGHGARLGRRRAGRRLSLKCLVYLRSDFLDQAWVQVAGNDFTRVFE